MQIDSGLYISDKALARVRQLLDEEGKGDDYFVRVSVVSGGGVAGSLLVSFAPRVQRSLDAKQGAVPGNVKRGITFF